MTEICQTVAMVSVAYGQGRIQGGRIKGIHPPLAMFKNVFEGGNVAPMGHQHQWDSAIFRKRVKIKLQQLRYKAEFDTAFVSS